MNNHIYLVLIISLLLISCGSKKEVTKNTKPVEKDIYLNTEDDLLIAGSTNFNENESLSIYTAILKNVVGNKPGAYIGNKMDKLANFFDNNVESSELLRAGEGLILEFNSTSNLNFENGKTNLNASTKETMSVIVTALKNFPKVNLIIESHTDSSGEEAINMKMTTERVNSINTYLVENGIEASRIKTKSFGEKQPKFENNTNLNQQKNRRIEFGFYASEELKAEAKTMTEE